MDMKPPSLNQLSEHVYWLAPDSTTDRPTLGAIVGKHSTLVVDAGNSATHANLFLDALTKLGVAPPRYVVLTHSHWDHVFGTSAFDTPIFAHQETQTIVAEMVDLDWGDAALDQRVVDGREIEFCRDMIKAELPDRTDLQIKPVDIAFATQLDFDLGGVRCQVKHVGGDHAADSSIVYVPDNRVIFLSDCLYEDLHHGPRNYTVAKLFPLLDEIESYAADYYVWGHHLEPMPKTEMMAFTELLRSIGEQVEQVGDNRNAILKALEGAISPSLEEDYMEIIDAFLAGLRMP